LFFKLSINIPKGWIYREFEYLFYFNRKELYIFNNMIMSFFKKKEFREKGILMMIIASILLALMAIVVKSIEGVTRFEILFFQCIPTMVFMPVLLKKNKIPILGNNRISLISRGLFGFFSLIAYYYSLQKMNVASAVTLLQLSPFFYHFIVCVFFKRKKSFLPNTDYFISLFGNIIHC